MRVLGAVLAGGRSQRFGSDKAEALLDGRRLIDHAAAALCRHADDVIVVGRSDPAHVSIPDAPGAGLGPLGGLCAALHHARRNGYDMVLVMPCDAPDLPDTAARALLVGCPAVAATQPVVGCWPASLGTVLEKYLAGGGRRAMRAWCETAGAKLLALPQISNINRPEDLPR